MGRRFIPARTPDGEVPEVQSVSYLTGQLIVRGAVVFTDAAGLLNLAGANPASILGVALEDAASKPGWQAANSPTVITGRVQEVSTAIANRSSVFSGRMISGATDPFTPLQADLNTSFNIVNQGNGDWVIDHANVAAARVRVVDVDIPNNLALFKFLEANLQRP